MVKKIYILFFITVIFFLAKSQDIHFSQFYANPISYNPANTGFYNGSYRLGLNHKQQWPWAAKGKLLNYNSSSIYGDFSFLDKKLNNTDWAGIGLNYINDNAGDGNLKAHKTYVSLAYHKGLDKHHKHFISLGFNLGIVYRSIDYEALHFNSQWVDRIGFVTGLPQDEEYYKPNTLYYDLGFGLQGSNQINEKFNFRYGFSMLHLNKPKESFYLDDNKLGLRYLVHGIVNYDINNQVNLEGGFYYSTQKKAHEILLSVLSGFTLNQNTKQKKSTLYAGILYRINDALSPLVGYQYHKTRLLVNYDINLSSLTRASKGNGGFEISLIQMGTFKRKRNYKYKTFCPSF